jgi:hypothetical protein
MTSSHSRPTFFVFTHSCTAVASPSALPRRAPREYLEWGMPLRCSRLDNRRGATPLRKRPSLSASFLDRRRLAPGVVCQRTIAGRRTPTLLARPLNWGRDGRTLKVHLRRLLPFCGADCRLWYGAAVQSWPRQVRPLLPRPVRVVQETNRSSRSAAVGRARDRAAHGTDRRLCPARPRIVLGRWAATSGAPIRFVGAIKTAAQDSPRREVITLGKRARALGGD